MAQVVEQVFNYLVSNYALYMVITMSCVISITIAVLSLVKKPIKLLTAKISNEKVRKLVNKIFIFFAFGISATIWYVLQIVSAEYFAFEATQVLLTGAFSVVLYALGDGVITKSKAISIVEDITTDENTEKTKDPEKEFWNLVK